MTRKPKALIAAAALALAGTLLLASYVRSAEARATEGDDLVPVLVVTETITAGTPADQLATRVTTQQVPENVRTDGAVVDLADLGNRVASVDLIGGDQLTSSRFVAPDDLHEAVVPDGLLEVTVPLDPARALGGALAPSQHVSVLMSLDDRGDGQPVTHMIANQVLVTRVQGTAPAPVQDGDAAVQIAPTASMLVTLAIDAVSVEKVVFAAEHGRLWLSAESDGATFTGTSIQTKDSVLG